MSPLFELLDASIKIQVRGIQFFSQNILECFGILIKYVVPRLVMLDEQLFKEFVPQLSLLPEKLQKQKKYIEQIT